MKIFPAIDVLNQKVVRLYQGDYNQSTVFGEDPVAYAQNFEAQGAKYLHLVDLDGAKDGQQRYFEVAKQIAETTNLFVELGGGIRDEKAIKRCLDSGVSRVILGTIAQKDPEFTQKMLAKYQDKIAIGVDAREGKVAVEGWLETTETDAFTFCQQLAKWQAKTVIFTEISRDGTGQGLNIELYQKLLTIEGLEIIASGGVASMEDILALKAIGIHGVIVGKALYDQSLKLAEILKVVDENDS
ncbi:1-(5-phosphoribosyl)-5-[(5-phosphoribosylamino)methylideneamino]imidazole-4-carboxamide isomerase [Enterococcus columbae]|uniref:1-(5-phosphoribosyl)-5-[(5-phosphoribosylamino)methylideneamino] imidazole-4-carboxamide isomerase n=1 Tax=Enterococcus columbae DSM 7374 = ATCC 51263 TaxID=1121865 RepID=S0KH66_9ENTE|nr:1-(5-phosphoribosyl)-5-[(5-phosphoribosylamino)methylideneamino]imidazole-4-carboxamide isomerase [Enterococcus columbae]EOT44179.1 1-(5-phosphoribosyl)-5-[(5-phosphoribosylamino)methylideneamino]imidazole-4-carboxamide isomerase [Enterococcus columbae DSM 7374 = ATCC 51263]EOW84337.1 1-(5-phosphoribosyl)-5-[(5-phosphoribosylamino)methylideneamino]imidazole-4-carboxamide isomerase [Enterococcus columbae DSM 7374 = ATCC 51263]